MKVPMKMRPAVDRFLLLFVAIVAINCARTRATRVQDPGYMGRSFTAPAIFADITDLHNRQLVEEAMVTALARHGVRARAAVHLIPPTRDYTPEERLQILRGAGLDSLVVITAAWGTSRHYVPVTSSTTTTQGSMDIYRNQAIYRERSQTQYQGGYEVEKPWAKGEFVILDLATGQKAWLGTSETRGESIASWDEIRKSACEQVAKLMAADRILAPGSTPSVPTSPPMVAAAPLMGDAGPPSIAPSAVPDAAEIDPVHAEPVHAFGLIDRKCQMQHAAANGELKRSQAGDRMASSCLRRGKNIRCTMSGQDPGTTFQGSETNELEFTIFLETDDVTASKTTTKAGNTFLFIYPNSSKFVIADNVLTGSLERRSV
jgi:hypothetical protein